MAHTLITHEVGDFNKWKEVFDAAREVRAAAGEKSWRIFQEDDNPNLVTVLTEFDSMDHARAHLQSDAFKEKIKNAGVTSEPRIRFLEEVS